LMVWISPSWLHGNLAVLITWRSCDVVRWKQHGARLSVVLSHESLSMRRRKWTLCAQHSGVETYKYYPSLNCTTPVTTFHTYIKFTATVKVKLSLYLTKRHAMKTYLYLTNHHAMKTYPVLN
jgi:hypothetical protein